MGHTGPPVLMMVSWSSLEPKHASKGTNCTVYIICTNYENSELLHVVNALPAS